MGLVSLLQKQVESRAQIICQQRNQSTPAELGKASYETLPNGVIFSKQHFLLDSNHCDYTTSVAKVIWSDEDKKWQLFQLCETDSDTWIPYPFLASSSDLTAIMREVAKDPKTIFWDD